MLQYAKLYSSDIIGRVLEIDIYIDLTALIIHGDLPVIDMFQQLAVNGGQLFPGAYMLLHQGLEGRQLFYSEFLRSGYTLYRQGNFERELCIRLPVCAVIYPVHRAADQ